jgi:hypothetical protein
MLSMAITDPIATRCPPSASLTSGGRNALTRGPVTPLKSPPRPTIKQAAYTVRTRIRLMFWCLILVVETTRCRAGRAW